MNETLYIVAQNYSAFVYWCRKKGLSPHGGAVRYVRDAKTLHGLFNVRVLCIEGWNDRLDWREIYQQVLFVQRRLTP